MSAAAPRTVAHQLIAAHLVEGEMTPGHEIALTMDQTLTQDATGTLVMLELEAMGLDRVRTELSAQYVDHNLLQQDHRNPDDHEFLRSASARFGVWYSRPGNGVSHPVHMQRFAEPGKTLVGADSHTPAAGAVGMLAFGAGGIDVARAMAGEPLFIKMPEIWGVRLTGALPDWVSAKDVVLELLRRHGVEGGRGRIIEYHGPGLDQLSAMDRHVLANMGTELGATSTVFPADGEVRRFLESEARGDAWRPLAAEAGAAYDVEEEIDLSTLEPLIARPSRPDDVVPVREIAGADLHQAYLGSSANPGWRDLAVAAAMVRGRTVPDHVSFDLNPASRQTLQNLIRAGLLSDLLAAGGRLHQAGCNGCIGMGQAPATDKNSLRTVPRNFPGRSGAREDRMYLCSPETATASALTGRITDPRELEMAAPRPRLPEKQVMNRELLMGPPPVEEARAVELVKGPNIVSLPAFEALPDHLTLLVLLEVGDDLSTDEISSAGGRALPYRSNIPMIARFTFEAVDPGYVERADATACDHAVVGGRNYRQGSSREHAALALRFLGLRAVLARSFARIHRNNLVNFGVLPLTFETESDSLRQGDVVEIDDVATALAAGPVLKARVRGRDRPLALRHDLSRRERDLIRAGGVINWLEAD